MNVSHLSAAELSARLAGPGLHLATGQFQLCIRSPIVVLASGIGLLYADYPLGNPQGFTDFHVTLDYPTGLRRWWRKQVVFEFDSALPFRPLPAAQAFPMLEWGLNWCVSSYANLYLIIHAAVVEKNGCAAILPAPPGSGKSTLCAALVTRGWRLLSDELTLIRTADCRITPLPRPVSLKNASIDIMQSYAPDAVFSPKVYDTVKGTIAHMKAPADSVRRANEDAQPKWVIFPKYEAGSATNMSPISPAHGLMRLADNAFNYSSLGLQGFQTVASVIDACEIYNFTYSVIDEAIAAFDALAESVNRPPALLP
ncbi:MAG: HprK-related kinase A [Pseudomonadota bacterium]